MVKKQIFLLFGIVSTLFPLILFFNISLSGISISIVLIFCMVLALLIYHFSEAQTGSKRASMQNSFLWSAFIGINLFSIITISSNYLGFQNYPFYTYSFYGMAIFIGLLFFYFTFYQNKSGLVAFLLASNIVIFGITILGILLYGVLIFYVGLPYFALVGLITLIDVLYYSYYLFSREFTKLSLLPRIFLFIALISIILLTGLYLFTAVVNSWKVENSKDVTYLVEQKISAINNCRVPNLSLDNYDTEVYSPKDLQQLKEAAIKASDKCGFIEIVDVNGKSNIVSGYVSEAEAIELLNNCKINTFIYNDEEYDKPPDGSPSGIIIYPKHKMPRGMSIDDQWITSLVPIAREARKKCPDMQFRYDGNFEQRDSQGRWYHSNDMYKDELGNWYTPYGELIK